MGKAPLPHNKTNCYPPYQDHYLIMKITKQWTKDGALWYTGSNFRKRGRITVYSYSLSSVTKVVFTTVQQFPRFSKITKLVQQDIMGNTIESRSPFNKTMLPISQISRVMGINYYSMNYMLLTLSWNGQK